MRLAPEGDVSQSLFELRFEGDALANLGDPAHWDRGHQHFYNRFRSIFTETLALVSTHEGLPVRMDLFERPQSREATVRFIGDFTFGTVSSQIDTVATVFTAKVLEEAAELVPAVVD